MSEFPSAFPDLKSFMKGSSILEMSSVEAACLKRQITPPIEMVEQIVLLMTPRSVLDQSDHSRDIITRLNYPTFQSLRQHRELIRNLKLAPARSKITQTEYEKMDKNTFLDIVRQYYIGNSPITFVRELFPADLPEDTYQHVVWIRDDDTPDYLIGEVIAKAIILSGLTLEDIILFERSRKTNTDFVRVAVPEFRHVHMWSNKEILW